MKRFGLSLVEIVVACCLILGAALVSIGIFGTPPAEAGSGVVAQWLARSGLGTYEISLPAGRKLAGTPSWKGTHLWLLTRPAHKGEEADTYSFKEDSKWGILEGEVQIKETAVLTAPPDQGR